MLKFLVLLTLLIVSNGLECRVANGVEYIKIGNNFQPDGCPDGLKCINEVCSDVSKVEATSYEGKNCAVYAQDKRYILVQLDPSEDHPNKYTGSGCGSVDGKNLTCRGDFGEWLQNRCPSWYDVNDRNTHEDCKPGCPSSSTTCDVENFDRGTCQKSEYGLSVGWIIFFSLLGVGFIACLLCCVCSTPS